MRILTIWGAILCIIIGKSQALYPLSLERLWTKIDVAGAIERFVNGVNEYYEVNEPRKQQFTLFQHQAGGVESVLRSLEINEGTVMVPRTLVFGIGTDGPPRITPVIIPCFRGGPGQPLPRHLLQDPGGRSDQLGGHPSFRRGQDQHLQRLRRAGDSHEEVRGVISQVRSASSA